MSRMDEKSPDKGIDPTRRAYRMRATTLVKGETGEKVDGFKSLDGRRLYVGTAGDTLVRANRATPKGLSKKERLKLRAQARNNRLAVQPANVPEVSGISEGERHMAKKITTEDITIPKGTEVSEEGTVVTTVPAEQTEDAAENAESSEA